MQNYLRTCLQLSLIISLSCFGMMYAPVCAAGDFVVIANAKNQVDKSSARQHVKRLYLKQQRSWPNGMRARVMDRPMDSAEHRAFVSAILGMDKEKLARHWISLKQKSGDTPPRTVPSTQQLIRLIEKYTGAFGVVAEEQAKTLPDNVQVLFTFTAP